MLHIQPAKQSDWDEIFRLFVGVLKAGETYCFEADTPENILKDYWFPTHGATYVAKGKAGEFLGAYVLKANQQGRGSHVCNASFIVAPETRGMGVGRALGEHALNTAKGMNFKSMQFNMVISSNTRAVQLWQSLGFQILATLPQVFRHVSGQYVDAYVMFRFL
ncbi:MAG: N-acetyltransferase [Alphaproteobacteria bacterium]